MHVKSDTEYIAKTGHTIDIEGNIPLELKQELVRCKDCIHHEDEEPGMVYCPIQIGGWRSENWFCPDGERKTDDT